MKHIILSLALIIGIFFSISAQEQASKYNVSLGGEFLYTLGSAAEFYSAGYGASLQGEYKLLPKLSITASGGYISLSVSKLYKDIFTPWNTELSSKIFYPVKAGLKYNFHKNFYAGAEAGAAISKDQNARANSLAYAGGLGTTFVISPKSSLDIGIRYEAWALSVNNTYSFGGLRAAYVFGF